MPFTRVPNEAEAFARGPDGLEPDAPEVALSSRLDALEAINADPRLDLVESSVGVHDALLASPLNVKAPQWGPTAMSTHGAIGDGGSHPLSGFFASLAAAQVVYPHATSLTNELDWAAAQKTIDATGTNGTEVRKAVYIPAGSYRTDQSLQAGTRRALTILGAGKDASRIDYQGTGWAIDLGASGSTTGNARIGLWGLGVDGNAASAGGLRIQRMQDFSLAYIALGQTTGWTAGSAFQSAGSNGGEIFNCDFRRSLIGLELIDSGPEGSNQIHIRGGQITGNTTAVVAGTATLASDACSIVGANIAVTTDAPAVDLRWANGWDIERCFFEGNNTGGPVVRIGNVAASNANSLVRNSFWTTATYYMQVVNGAGNSLERSYDAAGVTTALVRTETNASQTCVLFNRSAGTPLSEGSGSVDSVVIGYGAAAHFRKTFEGFRLLNSALHINEVGDPSAPAANEAKLYAKDVSSKTMLAFRDSGLVGVIPQCLTATATWDPAATAATQGAEVSTTVTVTGAAVGDIVKVAHTAFLGAQAAILVGCVSAADTVKVRLINTTAVAVDLATGTLRVVVEKFS
jgi:hypothetical protein